MDSKIKRFFNKGKGSGKSSGNPVRPKPEEYINQRLTASDENEYVAPFSVIYLDLPLVYNLWLT